MQYRNGAGVVVDAEQVHYLERGRPARRRRS